MSVAGGERVLAIDGGGSGCRLALVGPSERFDVTSGPANISSNFGEAVASIRDGLATLAMSAGLTESELCATPAYLGLAGVVGPKDAVRVAHALPLTSARIESDQAATVEGALGSRDGAVAGLGTGSFFGLRRGRNLKLAGGWGHRIDDRASGYWLGREALRLALEVADGLQAAGLASTRVMDRFGTPHEIVTFSKDAGPDEMAGLARMITDAAHDGDGRATAVLTRGARYIMATLDALGWRHGEPICLVGGVARAYAPTLAAYAELPSPAGSPLDGALARARLFARGQLH